MKEKISDLIKLLTSEKMKSNRKECANLSVAQSEYWRSRSEALIFVIGELKEMVQQPEE